VSKATALAVKAGLLLLAAALAAAEHSGTKATRSSNFASVTPDPSRSCAVYLILVRVLAVVVCGLLLLVLLSTGVRALDSNLEAETMTLSGSSVRVHSSTSASGGRDVAYYTNGSARTTFEGAATRVTLRARGTICRGVPARLKVYVDGSYKAAVPVGNSSGFTNYPLEFSGVAGASHTQHVAFENDYYSRKCDRNAYLDYATLTLSDVEPPPPPLESDDPSSVGKPTCTDSLQAHINAAAAGSTLRVRGDCIYREPRITVSKPLTLVGNPGAEIRGSDVWTSFSAGANGNYVSSQTLPNFSQGTTPCNPGTSECSRPEQVFVDGQPLQQLDRGSDPGANQFALDSGRHVVLGFNPAGKHVEVTTRTQWLRFTATAGPVAVDDIDMSHAANASGYQGALLGDGVANITVKNSHLSYAHGAVLSLNGGSNMLALNNEIDHGGQLCVQSHQGTLDLIGNNIHDCNSEDYDDGWEAGGVKATRTVNGVWNNNVVHHNNGTGLWCDMDCTNMEIAFNRVHHSDKTGIYYEISYGGNIRDNVVYENGWEERKPGIRVGNSSDVDVSNNVLAWNYKGLGFERSDRSDQGADKNDNRDVLFHGNWVIHKDGGAGASMTSCEPRLAASICDYYDEIAFDPTRSISFSGDAYWFDNLSEVNVPRFNASNQSHAAIDAWNATAYASGERYMTAAEKDSLIATYNLPASPEP